MPKVQFQYLNIRYQKRYQNKGFKMKENTGIDTETYNGYCKLICDNEGNYKYCDSFLDVIQFLTHSRFHGKYNWFYNIKFDFEAIVKHLDYGELLTLYNDKELKINEHYSIKYIDKKYFVITGRHNNYYYFYDMYNFLDTSLNKASKKFLNDEKLSIVDSSKLNTDLCYWKEHKEDILKYCIHDANLTKRLADYFWEIVYGKLNFYPKTPMSKGKLSEEYFLHTCNIPAINDIPEKVLKTSYDSFYGGHFELLKRGYFPKVYCYDIKSAYPAEISKLIDYTEGKWEKVSKLNPDCHSGFYSCRIEALEPFFSPFKIKIGNSQSGLNIYPNGRFKQYLTKKEIQFYGLHFPNSAIKIEFGYEFTPKSLIYPFKTEIERLYRWKESEKDIDLKYCVKIILNSLYGKFIQVSGNRNQTGKLFNPMYAAEITAGTRIKILELGLQKPDDIISFSTDSVTSENKLSTPKNPLMGDFELDFFGEGVFVMSDVYNLWNYKDKKVKTKLRGFTLATSRDIDNEEIYLKDILAKLNTTEYKYNTIRPCHLGECLLHHKKRKIADLNIFAEVEKTININGDNKRLWEKMFKTGKDCLKEAHSSIPLMVSD